MATDKQIYYAKLYVLCTINGGRTNNGSRIDINLYQLQRECRLLIKENRHTDIVKDLCIKYKEDPETIINSFKPSQSLMNIDIVMKDIMNRLCL